MNENQLLLGSDYHKTKTKGDEDNRIRGFALFKGALSRRFSTSLNNQNMYLCRRKPTNNGLFLLTIAI